MGLMHKAFVFLILNQTKTQSKFLEHTTFEKVNGCYKGSCSTLNEGRKRELTSHSRFEFLDTGNPLVNGNVIIKVLDEPVFE